MRPIRKSTRERVIAVMALLLVISIVEGIVPGKRLPPILVFAVEVAKWSDGTAAPMHQE